MRKIFLPLLAFLLAGCASAPSPTTPPAGKLPAVLTFVAGDKPLDEGSGIIYVGSDQFPVLGGHTTQVAPGIKTIGYYCPGVIYVDDPPEVMHIFRSGHHYEMYCKKGKAVFRVVSP